jgi:hypothetical protein
MKRATLIKELRRVADDMEIRRSYPGKNKPSTIILKIYSARIPAKLIEEFQKLPGAQNHNLERAMRLFLLAHGVDTCE